MITEIEFPANRRKSTPLPNFNQANTPTPKPEIPFPLQLSPEQGRDGLIAEINELIARTFILNNS